MVANQFARAGVEAHAFHGLIQKAFAEALKHGDAGAERLAKADFTVHGALGQGGDLVFQTGKLGQFVQGFAFDDGAVHIGNDQLFLAPERALRDHINGQANGVVVEGLAHGGFGVFVVDVIERDIHRFIGREPVRSGAMPANAIERPARNIHPIGVQRAVCGI